MSRHAAGLALLVAVASCAPTPPVEAPRPAARAASVNPCAPDEPETATGLVGGILGTMPSADAPTEPPLTGAVLEDVRLVHTTLGQGARSEGIARFRAPHAGRGRLRLEARSPVPGYGWNFQLFDWKSGKARFGVGCYKDRPRHTVRWTFALVDDKGNRSNELVVPVECTGQPMPGAAPQLDDVKMASDLPIAGKTAASASLTVTHPPYEIIASLKSRGNGWAATSSRVWTDKNFSLSCGSGSPHFIDYRFRVKDSFGRESNVVEKRLICGDCRPAR